MHTTLFTVTLKLQKLQPHSHERRNSQSHERNCFNSLRLRLSLASLKLSKQHISSSTLQGCYLLGQFDLGRQKEYC
ncbi:hypothetical protein P8452_48323 [Trifolium repens]|nr:hypothetical protein P8452_48323 [Trifolium repens]